MEKVSQNKDCLTGECPVIPTEDDRRITLSEGSGGSEMQRLIETITKPLYRGEWQHCDDDGAVLVDQKLCMTTDAYTVTPLFFPGGNIGSLAFSGTINDLAVMGADPIGLSLSLVLEEGLAKHELERVMHTIASYSQQTGIPIVTGDTKVMDKGAVDKMIITTTGVGSIHKPLVEPLSAGDVIIVSGGIGQHGSALLAKRYELEAKLETDSKPLHKEMQAIREHIKQAKDITRGGLAAVLNELAQKNKVAIHVDEKIVPVTKEVRALTEILGLDVYQLACEGRLVCVCQEKYAQQVVAELRKFNTEASIIGSVQDGKGVRTQTMFGERIIPMPSGTIVPRIC